MILVFLLNILILFNQEQNKSLKYVFITKIKINLFTMSQRKGLESITYILLKNLKNFDSTAFKINLKNFLYKIRSK